MKEPKLYIDCLEGTLIEMTDDLAVKQLLYERFTGDKELRIVDENDEVLWEGFTLKDLY